MSWRTLPGLTTFYQMSILLIFVSCLFWTASAQDDKPDGRLLNVFNIIKFPNAGCNTSSSTVGTCYSASECSSLGGSSSGSCASGFGVCCRFSQGCGSTISINNTYFSGSNSDSSPCQAKVCKCSSDVCYLRLEFSTFSTTSPLTSTYTNDSPNGRGQCQTSQFSASSNGVTVPVLCGTNTGYHMILNAEDACNNLQFTWTSSDTQTWDILVRQISCQAEYRPPDGCLQYFTGTTGTLVSYNYAGSQHLAGHQYTNCIRTEQGYCSIGYTSCSTTSFSMSTTGTAAVRGDSCSLDYITISKGGASAGASTTADRFCGALFTAPDGTTTVYTNMQPFQVGVVFDGTEVDGDPSPESEASNGFCIQYEQYSC